jgi:Tfp pilus assembly protein PilF
MESGEYQQARLSLEEAVAQDPNSASYRNALGLADLQLGRLPQALASFREAVRLNPKFSDAYNNLGVALAQSGNWEEAIAAFERVLTFPSYNSPEIIYQNLGWAYYSLGRYREAEKALSSALKLEPRMVLAHYTLGLVYEKENRKPDAVQAYRQVVKLAASSDTGRKAQERLKALGE